MEDAMDDKANEVADAVDEEDLNTTAPNPTNEDLNITAPNPPTEWRMPDPVFRKTSGRLPQGYEKELENARAEHAAADRQAAQPESTPPEVADPEPSPKSSTLKLILVLLGLAAMIGFIAVFLTVVYFFFLR